MLGLLQNLFKQFYFKMPRGNPPPTIGSKNTQAVDSITVRKNSKTKIALVLQYSGLGDPAECKYEKCNQVHRNYAKLVVVGARF